MVKMVQLCLLDLLMFMFYVYQLFVGVLVEVWSDGVDWVEGCQLGGGYLDFVGVVQVVYDVKCVSYGVVY